MEDIYKTLLDDMSKHYFRRKSDGVLLRIFGLELQKYHEQKITPYFRASIIKELKPDTNICQGEEIIPLLHFNLNEYEIIPDKEISERRKESQLENQAQTKQL